MLGLVKQGDQLLELDDIKAAGWKFQLAQKALENARQPSPVGVSAIEFRRGVVSQQLGDLSQAERFFKRAIASNDFLQPEWKTEYQATLASTLSALASVYGQLGDLSLAREYYGKALELDNALSSAYRGLSGIASSQGNSEEALYWLKTGADLARKKGRIFIDIGNLYRQQGNSEEALRWWLRGLEEGERDWTRHWLFLGVAREYERQGSIDLADSNYQQALELASFKSDFWLMWLEFAIENHRCQDVQSRLDTMPASVEAVEEIQQKRQELIQICSFGATD